MTREPTRPFIPDLSLAPVNDPQGRPSVPKANHFWAPTLWVMAVRAGFRTDVVVPVGRLPRKGTYCPFRDEVLRVAGFDPKIVAETGLPRRLWGSSPVSVYKQISYACKMLAENWWLHRPHKNHLPYYRGNFDEGFTLTEYGVAAATLIHPFFNVPVVADSGDDNETLIDPTTGKPLVKKGPHGNATAMWLDAQCQAGLIDQMVDRLSSSPRLKMERDTDFLLDHVQTFLTASIRTDAFASWLARGDAPRFSQLCQWAERKAISAFRSRSRDAHGRERYGALTKRERDEGQVLTAAIMPSEYTVAITGEDTDETPLETNRVIVDPLTAQVMEHAVQGEIGMARVYDAIRRVKAGNPDRFVQLFDLMAAQHTVAEIGEHLGVSRNRAANLMAALRSAIREAEHEAREARLILAYVQDEPYATVGDICEDLPDLDSNIKKLMVELVARGRVTEHDGSYLVTKSGRAFGQAPDRDDFAARVAL